MKLPRSSLAGAMLGVVLVAINLAALRYLYQPESVGQSPYLVMSLLPMFNVLAIVTPPLFSGAGWRGRPFLVGFVGFGLAAMVGQIAVHLMFPDLMFRFYGWPLGPLSQFSLKYMPFPIYAGADGFAHWRYYALLAIPYCWPQFAMATLGGLLALGVRRFKNARSVANPLAHGNR